MIIRKQFVKVLVLRGANRPPQYESYKGMALMIDRLELEKSQPSQQKHITEMATVAARFRRSTHGITLEILHLQPHHHATTQYQPIKLLTAFHYQLKSFFHFVSSFLPAVTLILIHQTIMENDAVTVVLLLYH